jgi:hypothetical protein
MGLKENFPTKVGWGRKCPGLSHIVKITMLKNILTFLQWEKTSIGLRQPSTCHMNKKGRKKEDGWVSDDRVRTTRRKEYIKKNQ